MRKTLIGGFLVLFPLLTISICQAEEIILAKDGKAVLPIITDPDSTASQELVHYLDKISGAEFSFSGKGKEPGIILSIQGDALSKSIKLDKPLAEEEFVIRSNANSLHLIGGSDRGLSHAVATFLRELGCRWYFPGETWEEIPSKPTIAGSWNIRQKPDFSLGRRIWYGFGAYAKNKRDWETWNRHNRMGGPRAISIGHTWSGLNPAKDFETNPEWFAQVEGKRSPEKPCYSHPEVIKRMTQQALKAAESGRESVSVSAPDGLGFCECERCMKVFKGATPEKSHGTLFAERKDGTLINITSENLFHAVNKTATAVAKKYPDVMIACYAYSAYSHPPSFDLHPNIFIQTTTAYRRTPLALQEQLSQFGAKRSGLGIREYYSVYQWDYDWPDPGKMTPETVQKDLRFFHKAGVDAVNAEASNNWAARGLGYYIAAQLMWDIDADVKDIIRDFYTGAFGPAAKPMERYFASWYGPSVHVTEGLDVPERTKLFDKTMNAEVLRNAFQILDEARGMTDPGTKYRKRVDAFCCYLHYLVLRLKLERAANSEKRDAIIAAIKEETEFGGRLSDTNLIHTRALVGKAFERRFRRYLPLLEGVDTKQWRRVGTPPSGAQIDLLWESDRKLLGL